MNSVVLVSGIIALILNVVILMYVLELEREKCDCSDHWMRDMIKYWTIVMLVVGVLNLVVPSAIRSCKSNQIWYVLHKLYGLVGLVYIIILVVYYVHINRQTNCPCALDWKRHVLIYPVIIFGIAFVVGFLKGFSNSLLSSRTNSRRVNNSPRKSNRK